MSRGTSIAGIDGSGSPGEAVGILSWGVGAGIICGQAPPMTIGIG